MENKIHFSNNKNDWETPKEVFDPLNEEFEFVLDVCANETNAKCDLWLTEQVDALSVDWKKYLVNIGKPNGYVWCNPPYNNMREWAKKVREEAEKGVNIVTLTAARVNTRWFKDLYLSDTDLVFVPVCQLRFLQPKITFVGAPNNAPFPSCIGIFSEDVQRVAMWYNFKEYYRRSLEQKVEAAEIG